MNIFGNQSIREFRHTIKAYVEYMVTILKRQSSFAAVKEEIYRI